MRPDRWMISSALVILPLLLFPGASAQGADETLEERALNEETGSAVEDPSSAKPNRVRGRDWNFYIAPYGWLAGTAGHIYTNGDRTDLDASFSDLAKKTRGGFQLYFEARRRKWFLAFDGTWATLGDEIEGLVTTTDIEVEQPAAISKGSAGQSDRAEATEPRNLWDQSTTSGVMLQRAIKPK